MGSENATVTVVASSDFRRQKNRRRRTLAAIVGSLGDDPQFDAVLRLVGREDAAAILQGLVVQFGILLAHVTPITISMATEEIGLNAHLEKNDITVVETDLGELLSSAHHVVFNSASQLVRFEGLCREALDARSDLRIGLRVNPEHSEGTVPLYDPCHPG